MINIQVSFIVTMTKFVIDNEDKSKIYYNKDQIFNE